MTTEKQPVSSGYKAINTTPQIKQQNTDIEEVNLEDITNSPLDEEDSESNEVEFDLDNGQVVSSTDEEEGDAFAVEKDSSLNKKESAVPKKEQQQLEDKRTSRAQKRIKQLHGEKTEAEKRAEAAEARARELEKLLKVGTKSSKEAQKESLEKSLQTLSKRLAEAIQNGESEEIVALQDELVNSRIQLAGLQAELNEIGEIKDEEVAPRKPQKASPEVAEKAIEWIEEHPQFKTDELFYVAAMTVSQQLVNEGYDDTSDDFYEELNTRLSPRFPEVFGVEEQNVVKYKHNKTTDSSDEDDKDGKEQESSAKNNDESDKKVEQTVSGASRTPPYSGKQKRGKNSVVLSPEMVRQAERWGLTLEQMARRVAHNEKNRDQNGYVPIMITPKK